MNYLSVAETAKRWGISERSVRNYCAQERVPGAFLTGKTWNIPEDAEKPSRIPRAGKAPSSLLEVLRREKESRLPGGVIDDLAEFVVSRYKPGANGGRLNVTAQNLNQSYGVRMTNASGGGRMHCWSAVVPPHATRRGWNSGRWCACRVRRDAGNVRWKTCAWRGGKATRRPIRSKGER